MPNCSWMRGLVQPIRTVDLRKRLQTELSELALRGAERHAGKDLGGLVEIEPPLSERCLAFRGVVGDSHEQFICPRKITVSILGAPSEDAG